MASRQERRADRRNAPDTRAMPATCNKTCVDELIHHPAIQITCHNTCSSISTRPIQPSSARAHMLMHEGLRQAAALLETRRSAANVRPSHKTCSSITPASRCSCLTESCSHRGLSSSRTEACYHRLVMTEACYHRIVMTEACYHRLVMTEACYHRLVMT